MQRGSGRRGRDRADREEPRRLYRVLAAAAPALGGLLHLVAAIVSVVGR